MYVENEMVNDSTNLIGIHYTVNTVLRTTNLQQQQQKRLRISLHFHPLKNVLRMSKNILICYIYSMQFT